MDIRTNTREKPDDELRLSNQILRKFAKLSPAAQAYIIQRLEALREK